MSDDWFFFFQILFSSMEYCCKVLVLSFLGELPCKGFYVCAVTFSRVGCDFRIAVVRHL